MHVINRPPPVSLESLASYLERVRQANYYDEAAWYQELLPTDLGANVTLVSDPLALQRLAEILRLPVDQLERMTLQPLAVRYQPPGAPLPLGMVETPGGRQAWHPTAPSPWLVGRGRQPVCLACVADHGAMLIPWYLRHVTTCPVHRVLLADTCPLCGGSIAGLRASCRGCGTHRIELPLTPWEEDDDRALTTAVWSALGLPGVDDSSTLPAAPTSPLHSLHPANLLLFLWRISGLVLDNEHTAVSRPSSTFSHRLRQQVLAQRHRLLRKSARALLDWPATWEAILEQCVSADQRRSLQHCTPRRLLRWFGGDAWTWLHDSWAAFLQEHMTHLPELDRWLRVCRERQQELPENLWTLLSKREAAKALGMSARTLDQRFEQTSLRKHRGRRRGRGLIQFVDAASVRQLQATRADEQTLAVTTAQCGLGKSQVVALVKAGLLSARRSSGHLTRPIWIFQSEAVASSLQTWLGALSVEPVLLDETESWLGLTAILQRVGNHGIRFPEIVRDLWSGSLPGVRVSPAERFDVVRCSAAAVAQYLQLRQALLERPSCSMSEVCERLQCKPATLRRLIAAGLLLPQEAEQSQTGLRFAVADVTAFLDRYITADVAAPLLGVALLTVQIWVRQGRLVAVTGPHVDGSHRYRFDRVVLQRWREERLTSGEAQALLGVSKATLSRWVREGRVSPLADMGGTQRWFARAELEALMQR